MFRKTVYTVILLLCAVASVSAQEKGHLTGSLESLDHVYVKDEANDSKLPDDRFATNNYLKLDYYKGKFSAGLQLEGYFPAVIGYPEELRKAALTNLYVNWKDDRFDITAGTFYDQFGSGLLFRTWEDRAIGINNSVLGARFGYNYKDMVAVRALWGIPHLGTGLSDTQVRGADLSLSLSRMIGWDNVLWSFEGSVLNTHRNIVRVIDPEYDLEENLSDYGIKAGSFGWSGRMNLDVAGFYFKGEYVDVGHQKIGPDQHRRGNAQLIEMGYNSRGLGVTLTGRRLERMRQGIDNFSSSEINMLSYVPAMCAQHTYMLLTLNPYSATLGTDLGVPGEIGGQLDAFYNFRRGTKLGGKRGMRIHANFSTYYDLLKEGSAKANNLLFTDFTIDLSKQFTKKFKMIFQYTLQQYHDKDFDTATSMSLANVFVADLLYKYTKNFSTRMELQYLQNGTGARDWMAMLLEVNFAPHWSIWGSDMLNHGTSNKNYYNVGVSYTKGRTRLALGYGRYRKGFLCSGGVCRTIPAYTGANFSLTSSF